MATASPSAVLAVPERPLPERAETKSADGADGQFAGLMAQFTQPPQPPPKAPDAQSQRQGRPDKEAKVKTSDDAPEAKPAPAAIQEKPSPKAEAKDAKDDKAAEPSSKDATKDAPKVLEEAAQATLEKPTGIQVQVTFNELAQAPLLAASPLPQTEAKPEAPAPKTDLAAPAPAQPSQLPALPLTTAPKLPSGPEKTDLKTLTAAPPPKLEVPTTIQNTNQPPPAPPKAETLPQVEPTQPQPLVAAQAVLAESVAARKSAQSQDDQAAQDQGPKTDESQFQVKATKAFDTPPAPRPSAQAQVQTTFQITPQISEQEKTLVSGKASTAPTVWIDPAPPTVDATVAKAVLSAQTPLARASDGSAMAAMNAASRASETPAPAPVAPAPPPPPALPSPAVVQVEGGIKWMLKGGAQEAQLQLHPESLGQVTIHLKVEGGEVHARLWVTEPTSVQTVQEGRSHLEQSLKEQGLQLGSFDLQQGHRPFQEAPSTPTYRDQPIAEVIPTRQEAPATILPSILNPHRVELYA